MDEMDKEQRWLSARAVRALPEGTAVEVTWSGGNGPWRYTIRYLAGTPVAATDDEVKRGRLDIVKSLGADAFVGQERWHTRVRACP